MREGGREGGDKEGWNNGKRGGEYRLREGVRDVREVHGGEERGYR